MDNRAVPHQRSANLGPPDLQREAQIELGDDSQDG